MTPYHLAQADLIRAARLLAPIDLPAFVADAQAAAPLTGDPDAQARVEALGRLAAIWHVVRERAERVVALCPEPPPKPDERRPPRPTPPIPEGFEDACEDAQVPAPLRMRMLDNEQKDQEVVEARRRVCRRLRKRGYSLSRIARTIGLSVSGVHNYVKGAA